MSLLVFDPQLGQNTGVGRRAMFLMALLTVASCVSKKVETYFDPFTIASNSKAVSVGIGSPKTLNGPGGDYGSGIIRGTGIIISDEGQILTNAHVVAGLREVAVTLPDARTLPATVLYVSSVQDLALLKIPVSGLTHSIFSSKPSPSLRQGEWVLAAGHPLGGRFSVTSGIISALHVEGLHIAELEDYIQVDMSLSKGYSGGPLFNLRNEVVGINTAVSPHTGNMSFAIPVNLIKRFLADAAEALRHH